MTQATPTPTPSWDDIADNETVVAIHGTPDELGRVRLDAWPLDAAMDLQNPALYTVVVPGRSATVAGNDRPSRSSISRDCW